MNIYHHPARGGQTENYTLILSKADTQRDSPAYDIAVYLRHSNQWRFVPNFFSSDVIYLTFDGEMAESFARNNGLQIEEGTE